MFADLRFVVDEVLYFMASSRGAQLLCQLARIQRLAGCSPRRIGLSATLNDYTAAEAWLNTSSGRGCVTSNGKGAGRKIGIAMRRFEQPVTDEIRVFDTAEHFEYLYEQSIRWAKRPLSSPTPARRWSSS
jgi:ATP-dependent Lhr-like helicase